LVLDKLRIDQGQHCRDGKLVLHQPSVHPGFVARVSPLRTSRRPPLSEGRSGGCGQPPRKSSRTARSLQNPLENGAQAHCELPRPSPVAPPFTTPGPRSERGGTGIGNALSHRRSIARNKNTRLETGPPTPSTPLFITPGLPPSDLFVVHWRVPLRDAELARGSCPRNRFVRFDNVFSHSSWISEPVLINSTRAGGSPEKSISIDPQSGRRPSASVKPYSRPSSHEP